jgi:hypothetical protein
MNNQESPLKDVDLSINFEGKELIGRLLGAIALDKSGDAMIAIKEVIDAETSEKVWVTREMLEAFKVRYTAVLNEQIYSKTG